MNKVEQKRKVQELMKSAGWGYNPTEDARRDFICGLSNGRK